MTNASRLLHTGIYYEFTKGTTHFPIPRYKSEETDRRGDSNFIIPYRYADAFVGLIVIRI